ncbi:MAG: hypothetical protein KIS76_00475 [Pyrinomonadaceae bacterium]|nr:hypothetical protein [Pyrinomonadaceae bacterium]
MILAASFTARSQTSTPTPPTSGVEVISLADDPNSGNEIILAPQGNPLTGALETKIDSLNARIKELGTRLNSLETTKDAAYDKKQRQLLLNLDILSRSEQRAEALRKQLFDMIERENQLNSRIGQIDVEMRPEFIDRSIALTGSLRPEDLRDIRRKSLAAEKSSLESLLVEVSNRKTNLQQSVNKADELVEKLRFKLEREIDEALAGDENDQP